MTDPPPTLISLTTILSLLTTLSILLTAYLLSLRLLPPTTTPPKLRILYIWHLFDALTHFLLEGSFLYISFSTYIARQPQAITSDYPHPASLGSSSSSTAAAAAGGRGPVSYFLGYEDRLYGPKYGTSPLARLWQEYAKADRRWGEADTTVVSLEVLTVFVAGPLALYVAELIRRTVASESGKGRGGRGRRSESGSGTGSGKLWYWATVLATCELYGGFMTFAPEWLSGSVNLDTSNFMYLWVYLFFFNTLWVWFPLWVLHEAYSNIIAQGSAPGRSIIEAGKKKKP